jgi:hypothetical protein
MLIFKSIHPFNEVTITPKNAPKNSLVLGIKALPHSELKEVHKKLSETNNSDKILRLQKRLAACAEDISRSEEEIEEEISDLNKKIQSLLDEGETQRTSILRDQILFIKNFTFPIEDENGKVTNFTIKDSREVEELGSLWSTSDECLCVLLDNLFEEQLFREPILTKVMENIYNINFKELEAKNSKN